MPRPFSPQQSAPPAKSASDAAAEFTGEISRGKSFQQSIGRGLVFQLVPTPGDPDSGWNIQVIPAGGSSISSSAAKSDAVDFAGIATPPFHGYSPLYLDTSYATKASEAVADTARHFYLVLSAADFKVADAVVNLAIYPNKATTKQLNDSKTAAAKVHVASGQLDILDSRITKGTSSGDLGSIEWLKFRVQIKFDTDMTMAKILDSSGEGGK